MEELQMNLSNVVVSLYRCQAVMNYELVPFQTNLPVDVVVAVVGCDGLIVYVVFDVGVVDDDVLDSSLLIDLFRGWYFECYSGSDIC